jgi:hypothetical protein
MGRSYYLTTLTAWRKHADHFAHSHYVCLGENAADSQQILVLIEADEGAHNALEQDAAWEQLPHPLSQKPVSDNVHRALSQQGTGANLQPGATTFDVAESLGRAHPLLRYRVF